MFRLKQLIREIHRRSLWQVLSIYVVGAWLAYQVILDLTEGGILPEWFPGVAVGLFIVGLPVVLATAFVQEGIGRDRAAATEEETAAARSRAPVPEPSAESPGDGDDESRLARFLTWKRAVGAGVFAFVFVGLIAISAAVLAPAGEETGPPAERSIAVLPLENMSPESEDAYFTDGIHEEIITRLYRIGDLRVLARASVMEYAQGGRALDEIARELGVNYLLVGSVRRSADRSRVSVALVEPRSGEQLWADTYQASGTDVFAVQGSIAQNVARALKAELTAGTRDRLATMPTTSARAYDHYLRARDFHMRSYGREHTEAAIRLYEQAVEADPTFALAHAQLGNAHTQHYWFHYDHSQARLDEARHHIDRALELDPDLPEAHLALGRYLYWGLLAYDPALEELRIAAEGVPSDPQIPLTMGSVHRRAGRFDRAIELYRRAIEVDPRYWASWWNLAETYWLVRRFGDAIDAVERAIDVGLNIGDGWTFKANVRLYGLGQPHDALATLDSVPADLATGEYRPDLVEADAHLFLGRYPEALAAADSTTVENQFVVRPPALIRALVHHHSDYPDAARAAFDTARAVLEDRLDRYPDDVRILGALAIARAGLGDDEAALRLATAARDQLPPEREAWRGAVRMQELAMVQAMTGRHADAVSSLEWLLGNPSPVSAPAVRLDPRWDTLHEHPGFLRLVER